MKEKLLFYKEYEAFYAMTKKSAVFKDYCREAFGADFSQDGFSDMQQIQRILNYVPEEKDVHILDIGCGNGKMIKYIQDKKNCFVHGFDYSENAIKAARKDSKNAEFKVGIIGEAEYPDNLFQLVISMDTMYFAKNMEKFVAQIFRWLKSNGVFFCGYQEGDIMPRTDNSETTVLAQAFSKNGIKYEALDITKETYEMLRNKRKSAEKYKNRFEQERLKNWYFMLMGQTDCAMVSYEEYRQKNARYLYVARK